MSAENLRIALEKFKALGIDFSTDEEKLFCASLDHMRYSFMPDVCVYAHSENDIARVLEIANEYGIPITPRGSGTGCAGGAVPVQKGIVLDLSALNTIEIYPEERAARVGAGAITADIDKEAAKFGLMYAPDPSSHKYSSIGGNVACNAGGLRAAKYGSTRDNVLAITAFLADGTKLQCGRPLKKFAVGLNLRDIFIGSEGTLGIISEVWLKLVPRPESRSAVVAFPNSDEDAYEAIGKVLRSKLTPAVFEFMDAETFNCVRKKNPNIKVSASNGSAVLLLEFDGVVSQVEKDAQVAKELLQEYSPMASKEIEEIEGYWQIRRTASQGMYLLGDSKISQDIVLPYASLAEYMRYYKSLGEEGIHTPVFGHSGDGNYHIHFIYTSTKEGARELAWQKMELAVKKAIELGGALSGEHGIGFLKSKYMLLQHNLAELEAMRAIKNALDKKGILNPCKIYYPDGVKNLPNPLTNVHLPWD